jgi:Uma2 family endonuclease
MASLRELEQLRLDNPETRFETTEEGKLVAIAPTGGLTGEKNSSLLIQVGI